MTSSLDCFCFFGGVKAGSSAEKKDRGFGEREDV